MSQKLPTRRIVVVRNGLTLGYGEATRDKPMQFVTGSLLSCPFCTERFTVPDHVLRNTGKKCPSCAAMHVGTTATLGRKARVNNMQIFRHDTSYTIATIPNLAARLLSDFFGKNISAEEFTVVEPWNLSDEQYLRYCDAAEKSEVSILWHVYDDEPPTCEITQIPNI